MNKEEIKNLFEFRYPFDEFWFNVGWEKCEEEINNVIDRNIEMCKDGAIIIKGKKIKDPKRFIDFRDKFSDIEILWNYLEELKQKINNHSQISQGGSKSSDKKNLDKVFFPYSNPDTNNLSGQNPNFSARGEGVGKEQRVHGDLNNTPSPHGNLAHETASEDVCENCGREEWEHSIIEWNIINDGCWEFKPKSNELKK